MLLQKNDSILFYGDSIIDVGRLDPNGANYHDGLGNGYVRRIAQAFESNYVDWRLAVTNSGISGNKVPDLLARLQKDLLDHEPTLVTLYIGINDVWHYQDKRDSIPTVEAFAAGYRDLCTRIRRGTVARLVIMEPFLLHTLPDRPAWRVDLNPRIDAIREIARDLADAYVPLDGLFNAAAVSTPMEQLAADGVHPTPRGHQLICDAWMAAVTK